MIIKQLLEIVVCPICYAKLLINTKETELICSIDHVIFPIYQGIPVLLQKKVKNLSYKITKNS